ncbi:MAG: glycosyltransferase family 39 protein, partial [Chloroflexus sp.]|uniref:glycosyltransferase family 39 protein n=1 Tax=Chloroflexus sp. TaxID=1904827 RepID=UPI00404AEB2F
MSHQSQRWSFLLTMNKVEWRVLFWLAPLAFIHTLIYVFLVPPWQHYDEPGHFLYAAYIVRGGINAPDDVAIAREVADSMYRHDFWPPGVRPDFLSPRPPGIPTDQRHHPPLYYSIIAVLISPFRYMPVEYQLYLGRVFSAFLMMLTVIAVWRIGLTITPDEPQMALVLAALVAGTPAFVDLMSALNSDVLMNFAAATAFLGFAILIRNGWCGSGVLLAVLGTGVAILTKRTAVPLLVPLLLTLVWSMYRHPIRWWVYLVAGSLSTGTLLVLSFTLDTDGLRTQPWLAALERDYLRMDIVAWLQSWLNWERAWPWYVRTVEVAHTHFWARLAWGQIAVWPPVGDWLFTGLSIVALSGLVRGVWQWSTTLLLWQQRWLWLCVIAVSIAWFTLLGRLHPIFVGQYIPRGRYLYWAMLPTIWLMA